jgi:hypothetical protein
MQVGDVSRAEVLEQATGDEVLGVGRAWKSLETWCFTGKLTVVRELIRRYPLHERGEPGPQAGGLPDEWDPRLHHEVAAALGISLAAAGKLVNLAWTLDARLPGISAALDEGRVGPPQVKMIVDETSVLDGEQMFASAEAIILAGLAHCTTWSDLARLVQRAVITVDPDGARKRREQAEREHARIRFWRESTGTCALQGTGLPTDQALAATANIEARALEYKAVPVRRPMDILRVMAYLDLINGVTVSRRVAWVQAEDDMRKAEADEQAARDAELREITRRAREKFREKAREGARRRNAHASDPAHRDGPGGGPDDPGGSGFPDWPPSDDDTGSPPGDQPPDDSAGPGGNGSPAGGPDGGHDEDLDGANPPGDPGSGLCPECLGTGGIAGLPVWANLTLPAGAVQWLAARAGADRDPAGSDREAVGPGGGFRDGSGPCPGCGGRGSDRMPARGNLTFPLLSLLGLAERPGEAHGLGALDPGLVRALAAAGARHPASEFCVTIVDDQGFAIGHGCCKPLRRSLAAADGKGPRGPAPPVLPGSRDRATFTPGSTPGPSGGFGTWVLTLPGAPLPFIVDIDLVPTYDCDHRYASTGYTPSRKLRHLVQVRDGECSFPACSRHAQESDFEHAQPFGQGGQTCACNAHACSRSCHRVKQSPGWQVTKPRPGWTQWTTMTGRTYSQGPWRYPA